jgi:hypothetical protein
MIMACCQKLILFVCKECQRKRGDKIQIYCGDKIEVSLMSTNESVCIRFFLVLAIIVMHTNMEQGRKKTI